MGYYVDYRGYVNVKPDKLTDIYLAMCALNLDDELKNGGSFGVSTEEVPVDGLFNKNKWFSWMPYNYPEKVDNAIDILCLLGFEIVQTEDVDGDDQAGVIDVLRWDLNFSNKIGQEALFLEAMAPFTTSGFIEAFGEDDERWAYKFEDGQMKTLEAQITWVEVNAPVNSLLGEG